MVIGEDEMAAGKVKIKEMGLRDGHPEKEGVLVNLDDLVAEVRQRIKRKSTLDQLAQEAAGLKVVGGIRGEATKESDEGVADTEKPAGESSLSVEAIGAVPAS